MTEVKIKKLLEKTEKIGIKVRLDLNLLTNLEYFARRDGAKSVNQYIEAILKTFLTENRKR